MGGADNLRSILIIKLELKLELAGAELGKIENKKKINQFLNELGPNIYPSPCCLEMIVHSEPDGS